MKMQNSQNLSVNFILEEIESKLLKRLTYTQLIRRSLSIFFLNSAIQSKKKAHNTIVHGCMVFLSIKVKGFFFFHTEIAQ